MIIMNSCLQMTKYLRDSIAAKIQIDFKNEPYEIVQLENIQEGKISANIFCNLNKDSNSNVGKIEVMIVAKTIKTKFVTQQKVNNNIEDLTGIFFIPAILHSDGTLNPPEGKYPWIPRERLSPIIEENLSIGYLQVFDTYMSDHHQKLKNNTSWDAYYEFSNEMYETVTDHKMIDTFVKDIELENNVYLFKDETINATRNILKLYDHLLEGNYNKSKLYQNFISLEFNKVKPLVNNNYTEMIKHSAQMGGEYPLSFSQRESVNHFNNMEEGEILAVNGPPGTGKTTLLQSLVANLYVDKALKKDKAPLIVASSTNNQAVTNIIESFGKINKKWETSNLEERWVEGVNSFAVYFPSKSKMKEADQKEFQHTNPQGDNFFANLESEENLQASKIKFLKECSNYFNKTFNSIDECEASIWARMKDVHDMGGELLQLFHQYSQVSTNEYDMDIYLTKLKVEIDNDLTKLENIQERVKAWIDHCKSIPFYYRWLSFLPNFKKKIINRNRLFIQHGESFLHESMDIEKVIAIYSNKADEIRANRLRNENLYNTVEKINTKFKTNIERLFNLKIIKDEKVLFNSLDKLNEFLDTSIRYVSFWLAVHYFECRWIKGKRLTEAQKGKNFKNVLEQSYENLSMITPCYVMTFYQLPKLLLAFDGKNQQFLYNQIDLLIVDEAGQVTPEIAACSFSLAKRAVVVGDVYQIEPVWNINRSLDISMAIAAGVIKEKNDFEKLSALGLNTSESSVMKVACKCCNYKKFGDRGLFLSEHRRCYDEIIEYCNRLVYKGNLEPMRGLGRNDGEYRLRNLSIPHFGHIQVDSVESSKRAGSRYNEKEAEAISEWVSKYFNEIKKAYPKEDLKNLIGIVTPFRMQVQVIKKALPSGMKKMIDVGTVHTFQGGERRVIIMSTVYGINDGCYFMDTSKSLLNVAVSRAKDSFIVFGEIGCLSENEVESSGLLKKMISNC